MDLGGFDTDGSGDLGSLGKSLQGLLPPMLAERRGGLLDLPDVDGEQVEGFRDREETDIRTEGLGQADTLVDGATRAMSRRLL